MKYRKFEVLSQVSESLTKHRLALRAKNIDLIISTGPTLCLFDVPKLFAIKIHSGK